MLDDRITAVMTIDDLVLSDDEYKKAVSNELIHKLMKELAAKIADGKTYYVRMAPEYKDFKPSCCTTRIARRCTCSELILCKDCDHTPYVDPELIDQGIITRLWCNKMRDDVNPFEFCSRAIKRKDYVDFDCPWR